MLSDIYTLLISSIIVSLLLAMLYFILERRKRKQAAKVVNQIRDINAGVLDTTRDVDG